VAGGLAAAAAAAVFVSAGHGGPPRHVPAVRQALATPARIGSYTRDLRAEKQLDLSHDEQYLTQVDPGQVTGIVAAVYDTGGPASSPASVAVIAGRLGTGPPASVINSFTQQETAEKNAPVMVAAGPQGGKAACAGRGGSAICLWADNGTVGVLVSATMNTSVLARVMLTVRSGVEVQVH
jgi:hypothetical protein